jgi:hypothetical protein
VKSQFIAFAFFLMAYCTSATRAATPEQDLHSDVPTSLIDVLVRLNGEARSALLGRLVPCTGIGSSFIGHGAVAFYWSVRCLDGRSFAVQVMPDPLQNKIMSCQLLLERTGVKCPASPPAHH